MVLEERARFRRLFGALVLSLGSAQACRATMTTGDTSDADAAPSNADSSSEPPVESGPPLDAALAADCVSSYELLEAGPDADPCNVFLPCGLPKTLVTSGCELYYAEPTSTPLQARDMFCHVIEGEGCLDGAYDPSSDSIGVMCTDCFGGGGGGRASSGIEPMRRYRAASELGSYFARMAHDEAASIYAFARLRAELVHHGAPPELVHAAKAAERDEIRHARMMARRALGLGAEPPTPRIRVARRPRTLGAIARENAIEGCVRETFGALVATWQAHHASDPSLRKLFSRIAADETDHAALSWAVGRWMESRLPKAGRARVRAAREKAILGLRRDIRRQKPSPDRRTLGLPDGPSASSLLDAMRAALA